VVTGSVTEEVSVPELFGGFYAGRRVLVTGHTGFKGSWLCEWLLTLGAEVTGLALAPEGDDPLFDRLHLAERLDSRIGDVRDADLVAGVLADVHPDVVLHLAAQPLVRRSYLEPALTFSTNVTGTLNVLEAIRHHASIRRSTGGAGLGRRRVSCLVVTSDKCYENLEPTRGYREGDPLGGHDPYSASKAAAEIVAHSYRRSFFSPGDVQVATARAGNVIGGGDRAVDRIVPDCMRSLAAGEPVVVRNPRATRPWQHVLEPLSGYLWLATRLSVAQDDDVAIGALNFGPEPDADRTVAELVAEVLQHWPGTVAPAPAEVGPGRPQAEASASDRRYEPVRHEAGLLSLDITKAAGLGWRPTWGFAEAVATTTQWYRAVHEGSDARLETVADIETYCAAAVVAGATWAF
jgi:CDP-glucose 4,6-dehydratase